MKEETIWEVYVQDQIRYVRTEEVVDEVINVIDVIDAVAPWISSTVEVRFMTNLSKLQNKIYLLDKVSDHKKIAK